MSPQTTIYAIYPAEEKVAMHHLLRHLKSVQADSNVVIWYDDSIKSGQPWKPSDKSRLHDTDIFLLLISNAFMYSEFIKQLEFKIIIDRCKAGTSKVIPLILENCPWDIDFEADEYTFNFNELHVLPEVGKPIKTWDSTDDAYKMSVAYIKKTISSLTENNEGVFSEIKEKKVVESTGIKDQLDIPFSKENEQEIKAIEKQKAREEAEAKRRIQEENRLIAEAEAKRKMHEENWFRDRTETEAEIILDRQVEHDKEEQEIEQGHNTNRNKKILLGISVAALAIVGILLFSENNTETSEQLLPPIGGDIIVDKDTNKENEPQTNEIQKASTLSAGASISKLVIGGKHRDGIIFHLNENSNTGILAHTEDIGPITWKDAMKIDEQLGEGWRLPTLDELKLMHGSIGQGADNSGEFNDGLYWSATPYDKNQARLVRFRDGNSSYHYNSIGTFRKFLVRAVRDFSK